MLISGTIRDIDFVQNVFTGDPMMGRTAEKILRGHEETGVDYKYYLQSTEVSENTVVIYGTSLYKDEKVRPILFGVTYTPLTKYQWEWRIYSNEDMARLPDLFAGIPYDFFEGIEGSREFTAWKENILSRKGRRS